MMRLCSGCSNPRLNPVEDSDVFIASIPQAIEFNLFLSIREESISLHVFVHKGTQLLMSASPNCRFHLMSTGMQLNTARDGRAGRGTVHRVLGLCDPLQGAEFIFLKLWDHRHSGPKMGCFCENERLGEDFRFERSHLAGAVSSRVQTVKADMRGNPCPLEGSRRLAFAALYDNANSSVAAYQRST